MYHTHLKPSCSVNTEVRFLCERQELNSSRVHASYEEW